MYSCIYTLHIVMSNSNETVVEVFPLLCANNSRGSEKVWKARILVNEEGHGIYEIEFGQRGGKMQLTRRIVTEGKNLKKKNETTPLQQCTAEIKRKWQDKQLKEGYKIYNGEAQTQNVLENITNMSISSPVITPPTASQFPQVIYPMLAQSYDPSKARKNGIVFPCYIQPKLDGLRCLIYKNPTTGQIVTQSRTGGIFEHLYHIVDFLKVREFFEKYPNVILDGELYTTEIPFENLAGIIKKKKVGEEDLKQLSLISYHIYDCILLEYPSVTFQERIAQLEEFKLELGGGKAPGSAEGGASVPPIEFVSTYFIQKDNFYQHFQMFVETGYEGAMLRNIHGVYKQNYRSPDLQKYKEFFEDEFTIVDFTHGEGRDEGTVIWICETQDGERQFSVRPRGSIEFRRDMYSRAKSFVGKKLTVIFQELTELGVPRFPVGKSIRDGF